MKFAKEKFNFSITIKIKDEYIRDCETINEFIKYSALIEDTDSNFVFQFYEDNKTIFESKDFGKEKFQEKI